MLCRCSWLGYRRYHSTEHSGLSTDYYDEVLVPVTGLNTTGQGGDAGSTGLGTAGPVAVFFEDPNKSSRIAIGGGGTFYIGYWETNNNVAGSDITLNAQTFPTVATLTVEYNILPFAKWYTVASGGSSILNSSAFNPLLTSGSGISNTNSVNTYIYYAACSSDSSCQGYVKDNSPNGKFQVIRNVVPNNNANSTYVIKLVK